MIPLLFYIPYSNIRYSSKIVTVISISHTQTCWILLKSTRKRISLLESGGRHPWASTVQPYSSCTISGSVFFCTIQMTGISALRTLRTREPSSLMWSCHALLIFYSIRISSAFLIQNSVWLRESQKKLRYLKIIPTAMTGISFVN